MYYKLYSPILLYNLNNMTYSNLYSYRAVPGPSDNHLNYAYPGVFICPFKELDFWLNWRSIFPSKISILVVEENLLKNPFCGRKLMLFDINSFPSILR